jgi:hypothetical protein
LESLDDVVGSESGLSVRMFYNLWLLAIAYTGRLGSPTLWLVITQVFSVPKEALLRRGATVELRPAF